METGTTTTLEHPADIVPDSAYHDFNETTDALQLSPSSPLNLFDDFAIPINLASGDSQEPNPGPDDPDYTIRSHQHQTDLDRNSNELPPDPNEALGILANNKGDLFIRVEPLDEPKFIPEFEPADNPNATQEGRPINSSEVAFDEIDNEAQTQTYVITAEGKIFPADKVNDLETRDTYELELNTAEQQEAIAQMDDSEEPITVELPFGAPTINERGETVQTYSIQTFIPVGKDAQGRTVFELSSSVETRVVDEEDEEDDEEATADEPEAELPRTDVVKQPDALGQYDHGEDLLTSNEGEGGKPLALNYDTKDAVDSDDTSSTVTANATANFTKPKDTARADEPVSPPAGANAQKSSELTTSPNNNNPLLQEEAPQTVNSNPPAPESTPWGNEPSSGGLSQNLDTDYTSHNTSAPIPPRNTDIQPTPPAKHDNPVSTAPDVAAKEDASIRSNSAPVQANQSRQSLSATPSAPESQTTNVTENLQTEADKQPQIKTAQASVTSKSTESVRHAVQRVEPSSEAVSVAPADIAQIIEPQTSYATQSATKPPVVEKVATTQQNAPSPEITKPRAQETASVPANNLPTRPTEEIIAPIDQHTAPNTAHKATPASANKVDIKGVNRNIETPVAANESSRSTYPIGQYPRDIHDVAVNITTLDRSPSLETPPLATSKENVLQKNTTPQFTVIFEGADSEQHPKTTQIRQNQHPVTPKADILPTGLSPLQTPLRADPHQASANPLGDLVLTISSTHPGKTRQRNDRRLSPIGAVA